MKKNSCGELSPVAAKIRDLSVAKWGEDRAIEIVGGCSRVTELLRKMGKFAQFDEPILITGPSGVGKESVASSCHLLSPRSNAPYISVNCPQYGEGNLSVSELFGHKKGAYTGAVADHKGLFETADGGTIFLDEIADLPMNTQVMLLRALAEGEFKRFGDSTPRRVNVRVIAATNRPLKSLIATNAFRDDLYFRLCYFKLEVPPLKKRAEDWRCLVEHFLRKLECKYKVRKEFSKKALEVLEGYPWPGNVRELRSVVTMGYSMAEGKVIQPEDFEMALDDGVTAMGVVGLDPVAQPKHTEEDEILNRIRAKRSNFWDEVYSPFMNRDLNRQQVRTILNNVMRDCRSYKGLISEMNLPATDYQKFMDFLRHHKLKVSGSANSNGE
ncbi:MAG: sigma-54 dependent transcriptional regulator [Verrucomicrobiales bacterium]|nr:sigma-54-dependent Fis family transcriptional regulator [Verrucomicrobiae bacterium]